MAPPLLAFDDVSFSFAARPVLHSVSFEVGAGELVCAVGPNGAGKTTALRLAAGLLEPGPGRVRCFGLDPFRARRIDIARRLTLLPQHYDLAFPFTALDLVLMGRYAHGRRGFSGYATSAGDRRRALEAMERCDVAGLAARRWDELSGGERRRVLLAQAFCQDAELLLLDEPTAALDPAHAVALFETLRARVSERGAAVAVTHDLNLAARFADRVLLFSGGELTGDGEPAEVLGGAAAARAFSIELHTGTVPVAGTPYVVPGAR